MVGHWNKTYEYIRKRNLGVIPIQKCGTCNTPFKWTKILKANWFYSTVDVAQDIR